MRAAVHTVRSTAAALTVVALLPGTLLAQRHRDRGEGRLFGMPNFTIEGYAGLANHGRFLLQALDNDVDEINPQRKLTGDNSFSWGGSLGVTVVPRTGLRLAFTRTETDLDFEDDTGLGGEALDLDDVVELSSSTLSLELMRFLLPDRRRVNLYAAGGVGVTWWNLEHDNVTVPVIVAEDDTQFRLGGGGALGVQLRAGRNLAFRLEAATMALGNPFTGEDSYVPLTGLTVDEPSRVRQSHFRFNVAYTFGRADRPLLGAGE